VTLSRREDEDAASLLCPIYGRQQDMRSDDARPRSKALCPRISIVSDCPGSDLKNTCGYCRRYVVLSGSLHIAPGHSLFVFAGYLGSDVFLVSHRMSELRLRGLEGYPCLYLARCYGWRRSGDCTDVSLCTVCEWLGSGRPQDIVCVYIAD
jgi:hypothetical protein